MTRQGRYPPELRERAVRMVFEHQDEHPSQWAAICSIAARFGIPQETLRNWVRRAETDDGLRPGLTSTKAVAGVRRNTGRALRRLAPRQWRSAPAVAVDGPGDARVTPDFLMSGAIQEVVDEIDRPLRLLTKLGLVDQPRHDPEDLARELVGELLHPDTQRAGEVATQIMELRWTRGDEALEPPPAWWSGDLGQLLARALPPSDPDQTVSVSAAMAILGISRTSIYNLINAGTIQGPAPGRVRLADVLRRVQGQDAHGHPLTAPPLTGAAFRSAAAAGAEGPGTGSSTGRQRLP
jgi:transposase-like protein